MPVVSEWTQRHFRRWLSDVTINCNNGASCWGVADVTFLMTQNRFIAATTWSHLLRFKNGFFRNISTETQIFQQLQLTFWTYILHVGIIYLILYFSIFWQNIFIKSYMLPLTASHCRDTSVYSLYGPAISRINLSWWSRTTSFSGGTKKELGRT